LTATNPRAAVLDDDKEDVRFLPTLIAHSSYSASRYEQGRRLLATSFAQDKQIKGTDSKDMHTSNRLALRLLSIPLLSLPWGAHGEEDKAASKIADSWLGHDASELLTQWPIDRSFTTRELTDTGETAYSFNFGINAYSYVKNVYDGQIRVSQNVIQQNYHQEQVDIPRQEHCYITFYADEDGKISRYEYSGIKCRPYLKGWGRPKNKT
jgi:hypothetical protein